MEEIKKKLKRSNVLIGMLTVQAIATGLQLLSKVILSKGTFVFALMAYRHVVATLCIAPFAFIWERLYLYLPFSFLFPINEFQYS